MCSARLLSLHHAITVILLRIIKRSLRSSNVTPAISKKTCLKNAKSVISRSANPASSKVASSKSEPKKVNPYQMEGDIDIYPVMVALDDI